MTSLPDSEDSQLSPAWRIRPARPGDEQVITELVQELADYEREPDAAEATPADFAAALFADHPLASAHVAEVDDPQNGPTVVAMALWFVTFSTWKGRHGIWLEDLYVRPTHRRRGIAAGLLAELAGVARDRGYSRFEWWVLDWNTPAHAFYRSLGAVPQDEWTTWRVDGPALQELAGRRASS